METTGCTKDTFYEDRYEQVKKLLFTGDEKHCGGIGLADMLLELLFDETLSAESVLRRIGQKYEHQETEIKQGGFVPLKITENTTFSNTHYLLVDKANTMRIGEWDQGKHQFFEINGHKPIDNDNIKAYFPRVNPCAGIGGYMSAIDILYYN